MSPSVRRFSPIAAIVLLLAMSTAHAVVTPVAQYRLGESDPGATAGGPGANPTLPNVGTVNLTRNGAPVYSAVTPPFVNTSLSMAFNGGPDRYSGSIVTNATDNFGVEAWVKSNGSTAINALLVYNGNTANSGWGLFRAGGSYGFLYGGVTLQPVVPLTTEWAHLALVRDGGITRFFFQGQQVFSSAAAPAVPAGSFLIGGNPAIGTEGFDGLIDEVRVFTFNPGEFSVADLNFGRPEAVPASSPTARMLLALVLLLGGALALRRAAF